MNYVFKEQNLAYTISDKIIIIKAESLPANRVPYLMLLSPVTGIIKVLMVSHLLGVNIIVKGTNKGATSAVNGSFSVDAKAGDKLIISSIGYTSKEVVVALIRRTY